MKAIKIMPEYGCFPLWSVGGDANNIDPDSLRISHALASKLNEWAAEFDETLDHDYPPNSRFISKEQEIRFVVKGYELALSLKSELRDTDVIYFDIDQQRERSI